jgi:hypothetical protein
MLTFADLTLPSCAADDMIDANECSRNANTT